jgi:starvation-inducible outer membrane lipoprotein
VQIRGTVTSLMIAMALTITACTASPASPASQAAAPSTSPQVSASVDPAVAAASSIVEGTLKKLVGDNPKPDREAVRSALVSAGIPKANVEVSVSRTPTGLDVDAMEAAALTGESCVMGQIRDGGVVVTVLPVLATGKCFVGDAR